MYLEIKNMALYGICYDPILETVCDANTATDLGYQNRITLYATVVTLGHENNPYSDANVNS